MKKMKSFLLVVLLALVLASCGRRHMMSRPDMHLAPSLGRLPTKVTVVTYAVNPLLDLAEGGDGRFSWKAVMWDKEGKETSLLAINLGQFIGDKLFLIIIPKPLAEVIGSHVVVFDHGGKRLYNHKGEIRLLDSMSKKVDIKKYPDFLPELGPNLSFVKELDTSSEEFQAIVKLYADFRIRDLEAARDYIYEKLGSNFTSEQLDQLAKEDSIVRGFANWLGRDWKLFVTVPFVGFGSTALAAGVVKVMTLPSIWGDRIDRPGYMEHKPDAESAAKMILRGIKEYGVGVNQTPPVKKTTHSLPEETKTAIKGTPCENEETYEAYNQCVFEYNRKITETEK